MLINLEPHDDNMSNSASMITSNINCNNNDDNTNSTTSASQNRNNTSASQQQQPPQLRCPRCDSSNTKFCYYNNYSLLQPRYFCKSCRRYWTKGGTLRNVPIGGGCRKNRRLGHGRQRPTNSSSLPNHLLSGHGEHDPYSFPFTEHHLSTTSGANLSLLGHGADLADQHKAPPFLYFNHIPSPDHPPKPGFNLPSLHPIMSSDHAQGFFSRQLASYLPSSLASQYLSNVSSINPMHTAGYNHDYPAPNLSAHQQTLIHPDTHGNATTSSHESGFKAFSLAFDNPYNVTEEAQQQQGLPWPGSAGNILTKPLVHEQKLLTDNKIHQLNITRDMETQGNLMELGTSGFNATAQPRPNLHGPKSEEGSWPDQRAHVYNASDQYAHNYWNHGGWHENMSSGYNPSADHHPLL